MEYKLAITEFFNAIENNDEKEANKLCEAVQHELKILDKVPNLNASAKEVIVSITQLLGNISRGEISYARAKWKTAKARFNGQLRKVLQETLKDRRDVQLLENSSTNANRTRTSKCMSRDDYKKPFPDKPYNEKRQQPQDPPQSTPKLRQDSSRNNRQDNVNMYSQDGGRYYDTNFKSTHTSDTKVATVETRKKTVIPGENSDPKVATVEMREKTVIPGEEEFGKDQKSKRASQSMRQNNPDIADLSDTNRPTKIAERFSELYDNEWTETFEALSKSKKKKLEESEIINILLEIVEQAYQFCGEEAESQIAMLESAFALIMTGEEARSATQTHINDEDGMRRNLLVQYRKKLAAESIERLSKNFFKKHVLLIFERKSMERPKYEGPAAKYTKKAVELTWWMCVQDPPVYMCPTKDSFNPNIYRSYTKSGTEPDFVVWPALKLYKDGGVLLKGVVQYK